MTQINVIEAKRYIRWGYWLILGLAPISMVLFLYAKTYQFALPEIVSPYQPTIEVEKRETPLVEGLDLSILSVKRDEDHIPLPDILSQVKLLSVSDRPDSQSHNVQFLLSLSPNQERLISDGERVYIGFDEKMPGRLRFEEIPSPIWMRLFQRNQRIVAEMGIDLIDEMGDKLVENRRWVPLELTANETTILHTETLQFLEQLGCAKVLRPDAMAQLYGGESTEHQRHCYRLVLQGAEQSVFYISKNSHLYFEDGKIVSEMTRGESPVAQILEAGEKGCRLKVWDPTGLEKSTLTIPIEPAETIEFEFKDVIKRLRKRTATSVSCLLGSKNALLKRGDWVIHTKLGWKVIKTKKDLLDVVNFNLRGVLFVFDAIDTIEGKMAIVGHLFDQSRSKADRVTLFFADSKVQTKSNESNPTQDEHPHHFQDLEMSDEYDDMPGFDEYDEFMDDDYEYFDFDF